MCFKFDKKSFRNHAKTELIKFANIHPKCTSKCVSDKIYFLIRSLKCKNILLFAPLFYEPNLLNLRPKLAKKYNLFLPFMVNKSLKAVKLRLPFNIAKFKVKQPPNSNAFAKKLDLVIIPVIGVDTNMARIGHGFGFYDRFLNSLNHKPIVVFVGIKDMFVNTQICDSRDIKADFYITPTKTYTKAIHDRSNYMHSRFGCWRSRRIFSS